MAVQLQLTFSDGLYTDWIDVSSKYKDPTAHDTNNDAIRALERDNGPCRIIVEFDDGMIADYRKV